MWAMGFNAVSRCGHAFDLAPAAQVHFRLLFFLVAAATFFFIQPADFSRLRSGQAITHQATSVSSGREPFKVPAATAASKRLTFVVGLEGSKRLSQS